MSHLPPPPCTQARNRLHAHLLVLIPGYTATVAHLVTEGGCLERQIRSLVGDDPLLVIPGCGHLSAESFDPDPYLAILDRDGIHHATIEIEPGRAVA